MALLGRSYVNRRLLGRRVMAAGTPNNAASGTASLTLSASGATAATAAGTASLTLGGTGTATSRGTWWTAVAAAAAGTGRARYVVVGDSYVEGWAASSRANCFVAKLADKVRTAHGIAGSGVGLLDYEGGDSVGLTWTGKPTHTGTVVVSDDHTQSGGAHLTGTASATWTITGTSSDVVYYENPGAAVITVKVDGSTVGTITHPGSGSPVVSKQANFSTGSSGSHTVQLVTTDDQYVDGIIPYNGDTATVGLSYIKCGVYATLTDYWTATRPNARLGWAQFQPNLVIVEPTINDCVNNVAVATSAANVANQVTYALGLSSSPTVVYIAPFFTNDAEFFDDGTSLKNALGLNLDDYRNACLAAASAAGALTLDLRTAIPDPVGSGYLNGDGHPTDSGHTAYAQAISDFLDANAPSSTAASGTGTLTLSASGAAKAVGAGTASLTLGGSGATSAAATSTASLSLSAAGAATAPAAGTASLSLSASGAATSPATGAASLTLSASGAATAPTGGTGSLTLGATGTAAAPASGAGSVTLSATGTAGGGNVATGTGSLTLAASGAAQATAGGSASITLSATGTAAALGAASGTGSISLSASGGARAPATATGSLSLAAAGSASASPGGTGTLTLTAAGSGRAVVVSTASLSLAAAGAIAATAGGTAQLVLNASGTARNPSADQDLDVRVTLIARRLSAELVDRRLAATMVRRRLTADITD